MKKEARFIVFVLVVLLVGAVIMDLAFDKIYNEWLLIFLTAALISRIWQSGAEGLTSGLIAMAVPVILLYPLFKIGTLGAGDIKLLAAAGCFMTSGDALYLICYSFLIGAVISLFWLIRKRSFASRMRHLFIYLRNTFNNKTWELYEPPVQVSGSKEEKGVNEGRIHFSLPILLSAMLWIGGVY